MRKDAKRGLTSTPTLKRKVQTRRDRILKYFCHIIIGGVLQVDDGTRTKLNLSVYAVTKIHLSPRKCLRPSEFTDFTVRETNMNGLSKTCS